MKQVILDTGVITTLLGSKIPEEIIALKVQLLEKEIQGHVTKQILLEVAKNLSLIYKRDEIDSLIWSFLNTYEISIIEPDIATYLRAGRLQYREKKTFSACDSLIITIASNRKDKFTIYTTDGKMVETSKRIKNSARFKIYRFS